MMRKRAVIGGAALLIIAFFGIWLALRPEVIGTMSHSSNRPESSASHITFPAQAGDRLRLSFSSRVEMGDLSLILYDSTGNMVQDFGKAKELRMFITLEQEGEYRLEAEYRNFAGRFRVVLTKMGRNGS